VIDVAVAVRLGQAVGKRDALLGLGVCTGKLEVYRQPFRYWGGCGGVSRDWAYFARYIPGVAAAATPMSSHSLVVMRTGRLRTGDSNLPGFWSVAGVRTGGG
jgi:hypothetical protein